MKPYSVAMFISYFIFLTGCANLHAPYNPPPLDPKLKSSSETSNESPKPIAQPSPLINDTVTTQSAQPAAEQTNANNEIGQFSPPAAADSEISEIAEDEDCNFADRAADAKTEQSASGGKDIVIQKIIDEALDLCQISQTFWQQGEPDSAIEALDNAYSLILKIDTGDEQKVTQQLDDLRFLISKRILEIYASRNTVVSGDYNELPIILNDYVREEIRIFTETSHRDSFIEIYKRSGKFRQMIVRELEEAGLPTELSWLPFIESGFKVNALSSARALGLWQFIPSTGYKFGLNRTKYIDERMDPQKSTKAAISYLKVLHQIFGDWSTVLAAYNCGEWRVLKVIRSQNINYLDNFWDLYTRLPRETARYVPKFMAVLHILENMEQYGFISDEIVICPPLEYETVTIAKQLRLEDIARSLDIQFSHLKELNAELRYNILPDSEYALKLPKDTSEQLLAKLDSISPPKTIPTVVSDNDVAFTNHKVRNGETLSTIAKRYGVSVKAIIANNKISRKGIIVAGEVLRIPVKGNAAPILKTKTAQQKSSGNYVKYVVKTGDSLWTIANRNHTDIKQIKAINGLTNSVIAAGQALKIPAAPQKTPSQFAYNSKGSLRYHSVQNGDVPQEIAKRYNMSLDRFLQINNLSQSSIIYPGQKLYID